MIAQPSAFVFGSTVWAICSYFFKDQKMANVELREIIRVFAVLRDFGRRLCDQRLVGGFSA